MQSQSKCIILQNIVYLDIIYFDNLIIIFNEVISNLIDLVF